MIWQQDSNRNHRIDYNEIKILLIIPADTENNIIKQERIVFDNNNFIQNIAKKLIIVVGPKSNNKVT